METGKEEKQVRPPFNMNIKDFKRLLDEQGVPKSARNKAIKEYKNRVYDRVAEVKAKMEKELSYASEK